MFEGFENGKEFEAALAQLPPKIRAICIADIEEAIRVRLATMKRAAKTLKAC